MADKTNIEWCDSTFNPWIGCTKVGPGCDFCYAEKSTPARTLGINWGPGAPRRRTSASAWRKPVLWNANHDAFFSQHGRRRRVFCASLADVFDNAVDPQWRTDLFALIQATPNIDWLLLTKRIGNVASQLKEAGLLSTAAKNAYLERWIMSWLDYDPPSNVWLGATVVNQQEANRDVPKLLAVPAVKRFLSMEPLLGPVDLLATGDTLCRCDGCIRMAREYPESPGLQRIDWVIVGGESGTGARPMHPDWARSLRDQCHAANAKFLFKQWGEWKPWEPGDRGVIEHVSRQDGQRGTSPGYVTGSTSIRADTTPISKVGKKAAGRMLDSIEHNEFPASTNTLFCDQTGGWPQFSKAHEACNCEACKPQAELFTGEQMRMIVCSNCGNKRCPHATNHQNPCTNSNAIGQTGSSWEHVKPITDFRKAQS